MMTIKKTASAIPDDSPTSRIVVAGATGYLGRHLVAELAGRGHEVIAIVSPGQRVPLASSHHEAQVTDARSLEGVCEGARAIFSALGITRQTDKVSYEDIEYRANLNLLEEAQRAGVERFGVISVATPETFRGLAIMDSRERFIEALQASTMPSSVVRATGFFSDMKDFFEMAARGRVWLIGEGKNRVNPIDGRDLARAASDALLTGVDEVEVGGPDLLRWDEIAQLAFAAVEKPTRISRVPPWLARAALSLLRPFHRRGHDIGQFILRGATHDLVAPRSGGHHLSDEYIALAQARNSSPS